MRRIVLAVAILLAFVPAAGAQVTEPGSARLQEVSVASSALGTAVNVRVLLPAGYNDPANATRRYPVVFLLHGMSGDEDDWTEQGNAETVTAGFDAIVVMPDGGEDGFYSDWKQGPAWESFHIGELVPWIDRTYRTVGTREGRAIAGLSMGGYGALIYAARHPDLFVSTASFSGAADIAVGHAVEATALNVLGVAPDARWGPFLTDEVNWHDHNPPDLALNLRSTRVALYVRNGIPRPGDNPASTPVEAGTYLLSSSAHIRFAAAGVAHEWHDFGGGTHEWHYWEDALARWLPTAMATFAAPPPRPAGFDYRTAEPRFSVWDWTFTTHRTAREFLELRGVQPSLFTAVGRGPVSVRTAPVYVPGAVYQVVADVGLPSFVVADADGRLSFGFDLGPNHPYQQYTPLATVAELLSLGHYFTTKTVRIERAL